MVQEMAEYIVSNIQISDNWALALKEADKLLSLIQNNGMIAPYSVNLDIPGKCEHRQGHGWDKEDENE